MNQFDPAKCAKPECSNPHEEGVGYCRFHGGALELHRKAKSENTLYRIAKYKERLKDFGESDKLKTLREEIGVLRLLLEERMNTITTNVDLMVATPAISNLVMQIQTIVQSCANLEVKMNETIDRKAAVEFAQRLLAIVTKVVDDPEKLAEISKEFESAWTIQ